MEKARKKLLLNENFYGNLLYQCRVEFTDKVPTAGVNITNTVNLYINPEFWAGLSLKHQVGVLKHEMDHLIFDHVAQADYRQMSDKRVANVAMDLYINEKNKYLRDFEGACYVDTLNKSLEMNMDHGKSTFYYYRELMKKKEELEEQGHDSLDEHGDMSESGTAAGDLREQVLKNALSKAAEQMASGDVPSDIQQAIDSLGKSQVNWAKELRRFVAQALESKQRPTRQRRNRRFGVRQPGSRTEPKLHLGVCVDTSASVSSEELEAFAAEIAKISEYARITVVEADYEVQRVYEYSKKKWDGAFQGRGGTQYTAAINCISEKKPDAVIYFTDGDLASAPDKVRFPFLWALTADVDRPGPFGKRILIKAKSRK